MSEVWFLPGFQAGWCDLSLGIPSSVLAQYQGFFLAHWHGFCSLMWEDVQWCGLAQGQSPCLPPASPPQGERGSAQLASLFRTHSHFTGKLGIIQLLQVCEMQTPAHIPNYLPWENCLWSRNKKIQVFLFWQFRGNKRATNESEPVTVLQLLIMGCCQGMLCYIENISIITSQLGNIWKQPALFSPWLENQLSEPCFPIALFLHHAGQQIQALYALAEKHA